MSDNNQMLKDMGNKLYNGTLVSLGTIASNKLTSKITKKNRDLDFKPMNVISSAVDVGLSTTLTKWLQDKGYIPATLFK